MVAHAASLRRFESVDHLACGGRERAVRLAHVSTRASATKSLAERRWERKASEGDEEGGRVHASPRSRRGGEGPRPERDSRQFGCASCEDGVSVSGEPLSRLGSFYRRFRFSPPRFSRHRVRPSIATIRTRRVSGDPSLLEREELFGVVNQTSLPPNGNLVSVRGTVRFIFSWRYNNKIHRDYCRNNLDRYRYNVNRCEWVREFSEIERER